MSSFLEGKRILVVDDREENRRLMRAILKMEGASVLEADDGYECIRIAVCEAPDVILMDFQMPGLDGVATTTALRQNSETVLLPVIFVTASVGPEARNAAMQAGAQGFLTKPLDPMQLSTQIAEILNSSA